MANCHIINCSQIYAIFGEFPIFWKFFLKKYYFSRPFFPICGVTNKREFNREKEWSVFSVGFSVGFRQKIKKMDVFCCGMKKNYYL